MCVDGCVDLYIRDRCIIYYIYIISYCMILCLVYFHILSYHIVFNRCSAFLISTFLFFSFSLFPFLLPSSFFLSISTAQAMQGKAIFFTGDCIARHCTAHIFPLTKEWNGMSSCGQQRTVGRRYGAGKRKTLVTIIITLEDIYRVL